MTQERRAHQLLLFRHPYDYLQPITSGSNLNHNAPHAGSAILWKVENSRAQERQYEWLTRRPPSVPLAVVLPKPDVIGEAIPLIKKLAHLRPRIVIPTDQLAAPRHLRRLLTQEPKEYSSAVIEHLEARKLIPSLQIGNEIGRIIEFSSSTRTVARLAKRMYTSRRTLGRHFQRVGLPTPSHWLQFGRLFRVAVKLQNSSATINRIALSSGYPDGFTLSNQMKRLTGCRPTFVRSRLGWEWFVDTWIGHELRTGGISHDRFSKRLPDYPFPHL